MEGGIILPAEVLDMIFGQVKESFTITIIIVTTMIFIINDHENVCPFPFLQFFSSERSSKVQLLNCYHKREDKCRTTAKFSDFHSASISG